MTEILRSYIDEWKKVKEDNSHPIIQRNELHSLQKAVCHCAGKETLTPEEIAEVNEILSDDLAWCD